MSSSSIPIKVSSNLSSGTKVSILTLMPEAGIGLISVCRSSSKSKPARSKKRSGGEGVFFYEDSPAAAYKPVIVSRLFTLSTYEERTG